LRPVLQAVQDIGVGGGRRPTSNTNGDGCSGDDFPTAYLVSEAFGLQLQDMPEITTLTTEWQPGWPRGRPDFGRGTADSRLELGLTKIQIDNALGYAFSQAQVSNIYNPCPVRRIPVVIEVAPEFSQNPEILRNCT